MLIQLFAGVRPYQDYNPHLESHARILEVSIVFRAGFAILKAFVFVFVIVRLLPLLL